MYPWAADWGCRYRQLIAGILAADSAGLVSVWPMRTRNVRVKQWNRYIERLPASSATPPGYLRLTHQAAGFGVVMPNGDPVQPSIDAALREAEATGQRPSRFEVQFVALKQGRRH